MERRAEQFAPDAPATPSPASVSLAQPAESPRNCREDALEAIAALGAIAERKVPPSALVQFGHWLDWPEWLKNGTGLPAGPDLPSRISVADDLLITANIVDNGAGRLVLDKLAENAVRAAGSVTAPALFNAPDARSAMIFMAISSETCTPYVKISFEESLEKFTVDFEISLPAGRLRDHVAMMFLITYHEMIQSFANDKSDIIRCSVPDMLSADIMDWISRNVAKFELGSRSYRLHGLAKWLEYTNPNSDPVFWAFVTDRLAAFRRGYSDTDLIDGLRAAVRATMAAERRVPRLKQLAAETGVSERTLVRSLAQHGIGFHEIVEQERRSRALELIVNTSIPLSEVAAMLGFTHMSSFGRSFRQWFGKTPGQFRRHAED